MINLYVNMIIEYVFNASFIYLFKFFILNKILINNLKIKIFKLFKDVKNYIFIINLNKKFDKLQYES